MFRSPPVQLVLALGALALTACAEDRSPTQPESAAEPASAAGLAAAIAPNTWLLKAAPPNDQSVTRLSAGVVPDASGNSIVYTLGGRSNDPGAGGSGCGSNILAYKIGTNTWTLKGHDPRLFLYNSNGVGKIGNTLYISGGESDCVGYHIDGRFSAYDPATNTVTAKPTPPKLTAGGVTGVIDGKLYVLPGLCSTDFYPSNPYYCQSEAIRTLFRYSPTTNFWSWKRQAPHNHANGAGGVINGKFYVAGGNGGAALDRYNPATDTWTTLAPLPKAGTAVGAVLQGKLFVVVSDETGTTGRRAYAYDPATNKWTSKAAPHWDHPEIVPITWGGKPYLLAVGGVHGFSPDVQNNPTEVYAP
jgi:N-acetylneuraminic acid mutarotase